ncbi:hypothetical protein AYO44_06430 [Planctomycetaceae bacterium SCGC AG-212-F19]|nr:hypothetical protein AYO44_06430 [Planctomycetaceae bacterium SCGC AG-212-F19]
METVLHIGLGNGALATLLAIAAAAVSLFARRPALAHGLWLLVLLKLVTPPLVRLPVPSFWESTPPAVESTAVASPPVVLTAIRVEVDPVDPLELADLPAEGVDAQPAAPASDLTAPATETLVPPPSGEAARFAQREFLTPALLGVWLSGSLAWLAVLLVRVQRFRRLLRHARPASSALAAQVANVAKRLGLARSPETVLVPGPVSPMIWCLLGPARLIVPADLLDRLDEPQRKALLAHELAHLRRRDHWVRLLELFAVGLYWWHPVVWWARKALREAEEQCCDAWVVRVLPDAVKAYAVALLETVNFLSDAVALPPVASGVGQFPILQRRLTMIMCGTHPPALSNAGFLSLAALGIALLPWAPSWAQGEPEKPRPGLERKEIEVELLPRDDPKKAAEIEKHKAEAMKLAEELERARAHLEEVAKRFADVQRRLAELAPGDKRVIILKDFGPGHPVIGGVRGVVLKDHDVLIENFDMKLAGPEEVAALTAQLKAKEAQIQQAEVAVQEAKRRLDVLTRLHDQRTVSRDEVDMAIAQVKIVEAQLKAKKAELEELQIRLDAAKKRAANAPRPPVPDPKLGNIGVGRVIHAQAVPVGRDPKVPEGDSERRMQDLERKLAELLKEVQGLRQEMAKPGTRAVPPPAVPAPPPAPR